MTALRRFADALAATLWPANGFVDAFAHSPDPFGDDDDEEEDEQKRRIVDPGEDENGDDEEDEDEDDDDEPLRARA